MMLVPRAQKDYVGTTASVGINAFGFLGLLLARDATGLEAIQAAGSDTDSGPMAILKAVTFPVE